MDYVNTSKEYTKRMRNSIPGIRDDEATYVVEMHRGDDGRLSCRIKMDDVHWFGKIFFPDRSWTDAQVGTAVVRIVREKEKYGFVRGVMIYAEDVSLTGISNLFANSEDDRPLRNYVFQVKYGGRTFKCFADETHYAHRGSGTAYPGIYRLMDTFTGNPDEAVVCHGYTLIDVLGDDVEDFNAFRKEHMEFLGSIADCILESVAVRRGLPKSFPVF